MKRVYFLKPIGMAGPIKIGCSVMPEARLKSLDIWSPFPLELIASAPGDNSDERRLHWRFRADRSHGEWFLVSTDLLALIDHVRLSGVLPPLEAVPRHCSSQRRRNGSWTVQKKRVTSRLVQAERRAFYSSYGAPRPARIKELVQSYQGALTPPPPPDVVAELEAHITTLLALPKCTLSWEQWRCARSVSAFAQALAA